ncbi:hypothetical protein IFVP18_C1110013 [Vibrio parahaemolyticus]
MQVVLTSDIGKSIQGAVYEVTIHKCRNNGLYLSGSLWP